MLIAIIILASLVLLELFRRKLVSLYHKAKTEPYPFNKGLKFKPPPNDLYPFAHRWITIGDKFEIISNPEKTSSPCIHYIDESPDKPLKDVTFLMLHGNPTWSFLYRKMVKKLSKYYRCVALDYPGFGLSTASKDYKFTPSEHSELVLKFVQKLDLKNVILVVQDWGGPIGLNMACNCKNSDIISGFVIGNTWGFPLENENNRYDVRLFSLIFGGYIGMTLGYWYNFVIRNFWRKGFYKKLDYSILKWYNAPFQYPKSCRKGTWIFPYEIYHSKDLLLHIKNTFPKKFGDSKCGLLMWGIKDIAFKKKELNTFKSWFKDCKIHKLKESSHFWQEDEGDEAAEVIHEWVKSKF